MAEQIIFNVADVTSFAREISARWNDRDDRFNSFANEVQRRNLRDLLNPDLYYDFMNDLNELGVPQTEKYVDLLNGVDYTYNSNTITYYGLKPFLCYHWLAIMVREGDLFQSIKGAVNFINDDQKNHIQSREREAAASRYLENATRFGNEIIQFLDENSGDYPIWEGNKKEPETGFNFDII